MCAASIERAAEHWFVAGPIVPAIVASAAVPGLLPPAKVGDEHYLDGGIVNSIPLGRAVALGADVVYVLQVGRIDRPLTVPTAALGGGAGVVRDRAPAPLRPRAGRDARGRGRPRAARPRDVGHETTRSSGTATSRRSASRIEETYHASLAYLDEHVPR